jgi:predicted nuclease with TOPRIM domain
MKICVPSDKFEEVMDRLAGLAIEPEYPEERAQDVNAEFSELISRLNALEATRDHLMNTLNRAANADQALRIEQELTQLDTEVVAIKGKMKLLVESVQLSEIDLNLYPHYTTSSVIASQSAEQLKKSQNFIIYILLGMIVLLLPWLASARIRARIFDFAGRLQKGK